MPAEVLALVGVGAFSIATWVARVVSGAVAGEAERRLTRRALRQRRGRRAQAMAQSILQMESAESDAPGDLQEVLGELGPEWKATHGCYILAARRLATEFRALRNHNPDPRIDVAAVQVELRNMLAKRKCRNKDMVRILPLALRFVFYPSRYEQAVEAAFASPTLRDEYIVATEPKYKRTWFEWFAGSRDKHLVLGSGR